jgi:hypothetical protein
LIQEIFAQDDVVNLASVNIVPLYNQRSSELQPFMDTSRGFKILRPIGWNELDEQGTGYL